MEEIKEIERVEREELEETSNEPEELKRIAPWMKQITTRGLITSVLIGIIYSVIVMKLNLTTGLVPNLNVSAALLAFVFVRSWTKLLQKAGFVSTPFTRQENTIIQTCAVACYSIAYGGLCSLIKLICCCNQFFLPSWIILLINCILFHLFVFSPPIIECRWFWVLSVGFKQEDI